MPAAPQCALSINVSRGDARFMLETIPHLVRSCNYPFSEKTLVVETRPPDPRYAAGAAASFEELLERCAELQRRGVVDRCVPVDYSPPAMDKIYRKHLGRALQQTHTRRGTMFYGYMFGYEASSADYFLHFDADMLLFQEKGHDWIGEGIRLLESCPEVAAVLPLPGPPAAGGALKQRSRFTRDPRGFYRFTRFTSRKFLVQRARFDALLPLELSPKDFAGRPPGLPQWEDCVSRALESRSRVRADLDSPLCWTLHALDHGERFVRGLPRLIEKVEAGQFPPGQAGDYDLRLGLWSERFNLF